MRTLPKFSQINLQRAFTDFDGDVDSIIEVLQEFLKDIDRRVTQLEEHQAANSHQYVGVVHEIANSLGTAWCFHADHGVRSIEDELRAEQELNDLRSASNRIKMWIYSARSEVIEVLALASRGVDLFGSFKN